MTWWTLLARLLGGMLGVSTADDEHDAEDDNDEDSEAEAEAEPVDQIAVHLDSGESDHETDQSEDPESAQEYQPVSAEADESADDASEEEPAAGYLPTVLTDHPSQQPWVGPNYESSDHKKLTWLGESVKLPPNEAIDRNDWYMKTDQQLMEEGLLTEEGKEWISISDNIAKGKETGKWPQATYERIDRTLKEVDPELGMDDIKFINFFPRPAPDNGSLELVQQDIDVAKEAFLADVDRDPPEARVMVISKRVAPHVLKDLQERNIEVIVTNHPAARGAAPWNRPELMGFLRDKWLRK